jgi:mannonate dehydratase
MEVFPEEGDVDMVEALRVLADVGYRYMVMPDHVPSLDADSDHAIAFAYCFGYIRALFQVIAATHPEAVEM